MFRDASLMVENLLPFVILTIVKWASSSRSLIALAWIKSCTNGRPFMSYGPSKIRNVLRWSRPSLDVLKFNVDGMAS